MGKGKGYRIGMSKPIVAKYSYNAVTKKVTYTDATYLGEAMTGTFTPNYAESSLYGDDRKVDNTKEITDIAIALGVTKLPIKAHNILYGSEINETEVIEKTTDVANEVGIGFISRQSNDKYTALVYPRAKFARGAETYNTKGQSVNYSTPTINGTAMESDEEGKIRIFKEDLSKADALKYVTDFLGDPDAGQNVQDSNVQNYEVQEDGTE